MLFDTSSPNRRRTVQITFASLAILMGGGLVLFGVGGATSGGGLVDALGNQTTDASKQAESDAKAAQTVLDANPKDEAAAYKLARARLVIASTSAIDSTGAVTKDGQPLLDAADSAWSKYLALGPAKPNAGLALQYSSLYASNAMAKYDKASRAIEAALVTRKATTGLYYQIAVYSLAANDTAKYKEARARALELAPNQERREAVTKQIDDIKKQIDEALAAQSKAAADAPGGANGSTPLKSLPSLGG